MRFSTSGPVGRGRPPNAPRDLASGQAIVFLLAALVILLAAFLWNVDLHTLVTRKTKAQNAGDAAALAAARWQAHTLNLVGQLNLAHVAAREAHDIASVDAITSLQARVCFAGPLAAFSAAQAAARKNGIPNNPDFTALLRRHAGETAAYGTTLSGGTALPEPFPGAWREYQDALFGLASRGVAAGPDNARFYADPDGDHILLKKAFYEAIAARDWCWFFFFCSSGGTRTILDDFTNHTFFDPLPDSSASPSLYKNAEFFGVGLEPRHVSLRANAPLADYLRENFGATTNSLNPADNWYFFSPATWRTHWPGMTDGDEDFLPLVGSVREEYDYAGADAVTRLYASAPLHAIGAGGGSREIVWTAAAKPFGSLDGAGGARLRPNALGLVLPAFRAVRLIPLDGATSGATDAFDLEWRRHCEEHLPAYLATGALAGDCRHCRLLTRFEDPDFRRQGSEWLSTNSYKCELRDYGGRHGGGTRRGH